MDEALSTMAVAYGRILWLNAYDPNWISWRLVCIQMSMILEESSRVYFCLKGIEYSAI